MPPEPRADETAEPRPGGGGFRVSKRQGWLIAAAAGVGALVYILWRRSQSKTAASTAQGSSAVTGQCTDASGNPVPCEEMAGIDYSGQLSALQTEIETLLAQEGSEPPAAVPPSGPEGPPGPAGPPGPTGTGTATAVRQYNAPRALRGSKVSAGTAKVTWSLAGQPSPPPGSYTVAAYQLNGKLAAEQTVSVPDQTSGSSGATVSGLHATWCYNLHVWANGGQVAPPHSSVKVCI